MLSENSIIKSLRSYMSEFGSYVMLVLFSCLVFTEKEEAKKKGCGLAQSVQSGHQCKSEYSL